MMDREGLQHWLSFGVSVGAHLLLLLFAVPVVVLTIEGQSTVYLPVKLDLSQPLVAGGRGQLGEGPVPTLPEVRKAIPEITDKGTSVVSDKVIEKPQPKAVAPSSETTLTGDPAAGFPGDRDVASIANVVSPIYPKTALNNNWEGTVVAEITVDSTGAPISVFVVKSSGYPILDEAYVRTIKKYYTFKPKRVRGQDVSSTLRLSYTYKMDE